MKKLTLAIFVALVTAVAMAQGPGGGQRGPGGPGGPGGRGGQRMDPKARLQQMVKDLSLTADQTKKVEALQKKMMDTMTKLRSAPGDRSSKMDQFKKMRDEFNGGMKKILTPAQQAKFEKMQKERMNRRGGGGPGGPGGPGGKGGGAGTL